MPFLFLLLAGCGNDPDADADGSPASEDCDDHDAAVHPGAPEVAGNGIDDDCDPSTCIGIGFADEAEDWALPSGYVGPGDPPFSETTFPVANCDDDEWIPPHTLLDLTGDGLLDLVVPASCDDDAVGATHWRVHVGGPDGFEDTPTRWALPSGYAAGENLAFPFSEWVSRCPSEDSVDSWLLRDLTGDGILDLVIITDCDDLTQVGTTHWLVHAGGSDGFAEVATEWSLPGGYFDGGDPPFWDPGDRDGLPPEWPCEDFTGDGVPDLMVYYDGEDPTLSVTSWRLHAGEADGFANVGVPWSVPGAGYPDSGLTFYPYSGAVVQCGEDSHAVEFSWRLLDDDALPDLLVTRVCGDPDIGGTVWNVHLGASDGFTESADGWPLPPTPTPEAAPFWYGYSGGCDTDRSAPAYFVDTFDGDRVADFVVTATCEDGSVVGTTEWSVYHGGADGFATEPTAWHLPSAYASEYLPFRGFGDGGGSCDRPAYILLDLTGDGLTDLVMTEGCTGDGLGETHWRVHAGVCDL